MKKELPVLVKLNDLIIWLTQRTERFPKFIRVTLGDRIDNKLLDILELTLRAKYSRNPVSHLNSLNMEIEMLRYLIRLSVARECLTDKQYGYASLMVEEIGNMIGGWIRSIKTSEKV